MPRLPTKSLRISSRLTPQAYGMAKRVAARTGMSLSQVLETSIESYCRGALSDASDAPWRALELSGFVGCGSAERDLSRGYKKAFGELLARKHGKARMKRR